MEHFLLKSVARLLCCFALLFLSRGAIAAPAGDPAPRHLPVYRIPLLVHIGDSDRSPDAFLPILEEINDIWLTQAGICFEIQETMDDEMQDRGMDLWFYPVLTGGPDLNGYFRNDHSILVRDTPNLQPAAHPAHYSAARTAAHELGHGLHLFHRQDSDDNLMRSKTFGWQLNATEIAEARKTARTKALTDSTARSCLVRGIVMESRRPQP